MKADVIVRCCAERKGEIRICCHFIWMNNIVVFRSCIIIVMLIKWNSIVPGYFVLRGPVQCWSIIFYRVLTRKFKRFYNNTLCTTLLHLLQGFAAIWMYYMLLIFVLYSLISTRFRFVIQVEAHEQKATIGCVRWWVLLSSASLTTFNKYYCKR